MSSHTKQMVDRLRDMKDTNPNIEASSVVSANGQIIASTSPTDIDEARILDISATLLSASGRLMSETKSGVLDRITIEGSNKIIVLAVVGEDAILSVLASSEADLGRIFNDMRSTIDDLVRLL